MNSEIKTCQNSGKSKYCMGDFEITPDDFTFYDKIKVPPPTFCPTCRLQRRLIWMKGLDLFYRKCDLCQEMKLSMYHPDAPYIVYCDRCWWSDNWDAREYFLVYDETRRFFEQWNELLHKTPLLGLSIDQITGELSSFCNHVGHSKNCSLLFYSEANEDVQNCYMITRSKNIVDSANIMDSEYVYDSSHVYKSYNIVGASGNNRSSFDSFFIRDCENVHHVFGGISENKTEYMFLGEKLTPEAWNTKIKEVDLGSYKNYMYWKEKTSEYFKSISPRPTWESLSVDCTGSYVFHSKNVKESLDVCDSEDSKFLCMIKAGKVRDCYDYTDWGVTSERLYECMTVGDNASDVYFAHESGFTISDIQYSKLSVGASHHFGCVSVRKHEYCIFNKQYSKEEYFILREKIIEDMKNNPFASKDGNTYTYGEYFPLEFSPHSYNDSFAHKFFPLDGQAVDSCGLSWYCIDKKVYAITKNIVDIPDHIKDTPASFVDEVIQCPTCPRGYRVLPKELTFLKQYNLPFPRNCPFCRIHQKIDIWVGNMNQTERECSLCSIKFKTHIKNETFPVVYCINCWKKKFK